MAVGGGVYVCLLQYRRYSANPAVVSIERDFHDWNGTLPSITFCYQDNLSTDLAEEFIRATWNVEPDDEKYLYYQEFLGAVVNLNLATLVELLIYAEDDTLQNVDFEMVIKKLLLEYDHYVVALSRDVDLKPKVVLTERGVCYTVNSMLTDLLSMEVPSGPIIENVVVAPLVVANSNNNKSGPLQCNFKQDQCFMKLDVYGFNASIAVHSSYDAIRYETVFYELSTDDEIVATYKLLETVNDDLVRDLTYAQRKCLFYDEDLDHKAITRRRRRRAGNKGSWKTGRPNEMSREEMSVYSVNLCLLKCRAEMAIALCGCKPHFYPFIG